jgi:hypothetical protein
MKIKSIIRNAIVVLIAGAYGSGYCQSNPSQPSPRVRLVAFCSLHTTSIELAYLALLAGRADNAEAELTQAYEKFPRLEKESLDQLRADIAAKSPKQPIDVTVMSSKKFSRCLSHTGVNLEPEHAAACYIYRGFVQRSLQQSSDIRPNRAEVVLEETLTCLGIPDRVRQ